MRSNGDGKPVVALDIDGTLGDYHRNFFKFADLYFGEELKLPPLHKANPGLPLWEHMGISRRDYRDSKLAYRQGGWKRWMPCYSGASDLTREIRSAGAEVWLCTTRPYLRLDNVDPDTREWLRRNEIQYDGLLFDPAHESSGTKYHELYRQVGERVASVVDDLPEMLEAATLAGVPAISSVILRSQPYNRHLNYHRTVENCVEMWTEIREDLARWKEIYG